uniref:Uncharacterized protein n=1 Tax=Ixodes scapularis TaxID=6945 RepID=A0A4D5RQR3_IXOSC
MARMGLIRSCGNMKLHKFLLFFNVLDIVYKVVQSVDGHTQGFIQTESDLQVLADGVLGHLSEPSAVSSSSPVSFADLEDSNLNTYASPVSFEPAFLDFKSQPLSMPVRRRVVVKNLSPESSIEMLSISGNTLHFHCSFFQEKRISPGGNTSFDVVFLGREQGLVENILFIHTSLGSFKYQVSAFGKENPYRLRPFVGVRMPLNSSYTPLIYMHNPHSSTIQLTEIYSSGGDLHLEAPAGESEITKELWEIPPYKTKPVMKANFVSRIEKNHTVYIRIKLNSTSRVDLILPVEVEVVSLPGIFSPTEALDFGVVHRQDEPRSLPVNLLNSGQKQVYITNVIVTPVNEAVEVKFTPMKVPPDTVRATQVATVTYIPSKVKHMKQCSGKIVVKSKNNQYKVTIPFHVSFMNGSLEYSLEGTRFYIGRAKSLSVADIRPLNLSNTFPVPVVIHSIELQPESQPHFTVIFNASTVLQPSETKPVVYLQFHPEDSALQLNATLRLHTNVSHFDIPISCYSGRLTLRRVHSLNNDTVLDFGTLGIGNQRTMIFAVINENPIEVTIRRWGSNRTKCQVEPVVQADEFDGLVGLGNSSRLGEEITLVPKQYVLFRISVTAPETEGIFAGEVFVETMHEVLKVYFTLRTAKGSLMSDPVVFENAFPGKVSSQNLYIHSTFSHAMTVTSVKTVPDDSRFYFEVTQNASPVLQPRSKNWAGKLYFDPRRECKQTCYTGLPTATAEGHQWLSGLSLPKGTGEADLELFLGMHGRWSELLHGKKHIINMTLKVDTSEAQGFLMEVQVLFQWPKLSSRCALRFPVTQVGNLTVKEVTLENPSSLPVLVQVVPLHVYPDVKAALTMAAHSCGTPAELAMPLGSSRTFSLQDLEEHNPSPDNVFLAYGKGLEEYFRVQPSRQSLSFQLTPGMRVRLRVGFAPKDDLPAASLLLVRNNLTVVSSLLLRGQGGYGQLRLGNKSPGGDSQLNFDISEAQLKDCDGARNVERDGPPHFSVRRGFHARNTGQLPVFVRGFLVNGRRCQGHGFRVLDCQPFELKPNTSKQIFIAFSPDFTLSHVERDLEVETSLGGGVLKYRLVATVPRHLLAPCGAVLPRPRWEPLVQCSVLSGALFLFLCSLAYAYLERDRILRAGFYPLATLVDSSAVAPGRLQPFDLRTTGGGTTAATAPGGNENGTTSRYRGTGGKRRNADLPQARNSSPLSGLDTLAGFSSNKVTVTSRSTDATQTRRPSREPEPDRSGNKALRRRVSSKHKAEMAAQTTTQSAVTTQQPAAPVAPKLSSVKRVEVSKATRSTLLRRLFVWLWASATVRTSKAAAGTEAVASVATQTATDDKRLAEKKEEERKGRRKKVAAEEETSSTTTETSNADSDLGEKEHGMVLLPDVCASAKLSSKAKQRSKSKGSREQGSGSSSGSSSSSSSSCSHSMLVPFLSEAGLADDAFETRGKGKAQRKAKGKRSLGSGEDALRPSSQQPHNNNKEEANKKKHPPPQDPRSITPEQRKKADHSRKKGRSLSFDNDSEPNSRRGSPPPVWDSPPRGSGHDEALAEIARQTESFALQHKEPKTSRPTSYSAAVAGGGLTKPTGAIGSASSGLASSRNPGVVGQRPPGLVGEPKTKPALPSHSWELPLNGPLPHPAPLVDPTFSMVGDTCSAGTDPKQEIAPVLRNMCASFSPSGLRLPSTEGPFSPWTAAPPRHPGFTPWRSPATSSNGSGHAPPGLPAKPQWSLAHAHRNELPGATGRWSSGGNQPAFGSSESFDSYWDSSSSSSVWGSHWWSSPASGALSPASPVESPTDSMADVVSSLGIDSPDASVDPATCFDLASTSSTNGSLSRSIWAHPTSRVSHPWSYSLFQEEKTAPARSSQTPPLGWQDKETL